MVQIVCTGKGAAMALPKMIEQVQAFAKSQTPKVLYLGTPSYDREDTFQIQTKGFQDANCPVIKMDLSEVPIASENDNGVGLVYPTREEMKKKVDEAQVVMVSGGNTLYAMNRWKDLGFDLILKEAANRPNGPVFCGGSAGAICWFEKGNSDSMNPTTFLNPDPNLTDEEKVNWEYICIDGLGFLKGLCVPHYDMEQHNGLMRADASEEMVKTLCNYPCIGIDENAAFVVNGDNVKVIEGEAGARCYRKIYCSESNQLDVLRLEEKFGWCELSSFGLV